MKTVALKAIKLLCGVDLYKASLITWCTSHFQSSTELPFTLSMFQCIKMAIWEADDILAVISDQKGVMKTIVWNQELSPQYCNEKA